MFSGKIFNTFSGISKKTGNPFYSVNLMVDNDQGLRVLFKTFVSDKIFEKIKDLPPDTVVTVISGVNGFGNLCVSDIRVK